MLLVRLVRLLSVLITLFFCTLIALSLGRSTSMGVVSSLGLFFTEFDVLVVLGYITLNLVIRVQLEFHSLL